MNQKSILTLIAPCLLAASVASAASITPSFTTFGELSGATFNPAGASGIPNKAVAIKTIQDGGNTITLGLTAFQRYQNPAVGNNGSGVFYAGVGANTGLDSTPHSMGATWGFGYYIDITGGGKIKDYKFDLMYDLNPAVGTDEVELGAWNLSKTIVDGAYYPAYTGYSTRFQDSQNLYSAFLGQNIPGYITPPVVTSFNPYAAGEYSFALVVKNSSGELGRSAINVNVPDAGSTLSLLGFAVMGLGALARRRSV